MLHTPVNSLLDYFLEYAEEVLHIPAPLLPTLNKEDFPRERFAKLIQAYLCFLYFVKDKALSGVETQMLFVPLYYHSDVVTWLYYNLV